MTDVTQELTFCLNVIRYLKYPIFEQKTLYAPRLMLFDTCPWEGAGRIAYGGTLMEEEQIRLLEKASQSNLSLHNISNNSEWRHGFPPAISMIQNQIAKNCLNLPDYSIDLA